MPRRPAPLTRFELEVMNVLWKLGKGSVREVQELLPGKKRPAYTTVQTIVTRLQEKGAVRTTRKIGNAHIYEPVLEHESTYRRLASELIALMGGSLRPLMAHLVDSSELSLDEIRELEKELQRARAKVAGERKESGS
jgi:BlaI family penicillinase repressor